MPNETKQSCATAYKTMIGGQALIEGIMMLGPEKKAVVVRKPDGELEEQVEERVLIKDKHPALGLPLLRGVFNFCSSLANGVKALMYSASFFPEDEEEPEEPSRFELWLDRHLGSEKAASFFITVAVVLGIVFSVGLFILLPTALTGLVGLAVPLPMWLRNLLEGVVRIVIFMGYLMLCSHMKDIHRVFQYHGAEHKTIFCYEADGGKRPPDAPAPSPVRYQLSLCGDCGEYPAVQRAVLLCGGDKHVCEDGAAPAAVAGDCQPDL